MSKLIVESSHFDRVEPGVWRVRTRIAADNLTVEVDFTFTHHPPRGSVWGGERQALSAAKRVLESYLASTEAEG